MHILPKGWTHPFRLHIVDFFFLFTTSKYFAKNPVLKNQFDHSLSSVFLWNLTQTLESCSRTEGQQRIMCFAENLNFYFQGRLLGYGEGVLLTTSLLFSFCPAQFILRFPSRFSSTVFLKLGVLLDIYLLRSPGYPGNRSQILPLLSRQGFPKGN